jgi:hypothetical protein
VDQHFRALQLGHRFGQPKLGGSVLGLTLPGQDDAPLVGALYEFSSANFADLRSVAGTDPESIESAESRYRSVWCFKVCGDALFIN